MSSRCLFTTVGVKNTTAAVSKALKRPAHWSQHSISVAEERPVHVVEPVEG